ncbi:hypothetical protein GQ457_01G016180 [Hibiscus cannabinus]
MNKRKENESPSSLAMQCNEVKRREMESQNAKGSKLPYEVNRKPIQNPTSYHSPRKKKNNYWWEINDSSGSNETNNTIGKKLRPP